MPEREVKPFLKKASADVPSLPLAARRGTQGLPSHKKEGIDDDLVGGVSMLSGYLNKVRAEDPEALYVIAGDMFRCHPWQSRGCLRDGTSPVPRKML